MSAAYKIDIFDVSAPNLACVKPSLTLVVDSNKITVRNLISMRVEEEVARYNAELENLQFNGLVQPTDSEVHLNGYKLKKHRQISAKNQLDKALKAFKSNGFFLFVDDAQVDDLNHSIDITPTTSVKFYKLVPLVGG